MMGKSIQLLAWAACVGLSTSTALAGQVTWAKDVAPIVQERCESCHRAGQMAPFSMTTFEEVRPWAKAMKKQVTARSMPPYFAHPSSLPMQGDMNLTQDQIDTFVAWADQGAKFGNKADLPAPKEYETYAGGWVLGVPDLVMQPLQPFEISADGTDLYQCFSIPLDFGHDVWVKNVEFQPDNSAVVHHFILFEDIASRMKQYDAESEEPGCECSQMDKVLIGTQVVKMWAPGNVSPMSPPGVGTKVKAGSDLILQVHYSNQTGEAQLDRSRFAIYLAHPEETIDKQLDGAFVSANKIDIKAGDANSKHEARVIAKEDITLYSTGVHMHKRGKDMGMWVTRPGETEETTMIWVPNYDFNWQLSYSFAEPFKAPKGTEFVMRSTHDNSTGNPFNPDPTVDVHWGVYTNDEMSFSGYSYTRDSEKLGITPQLPSAKDLAEISEALYTDANKDTD